MCRFCEAKKILAGAPANLTLRDKIMLTRKPDTIMVLETDVENELREVAARTEDSDLPSFISKQLANVLPDIIYEGRKALKEELLAFQN